jgi:hypothetical protein
LSSSRAGIYVKGYCDTRQIPTEGLGMQMHVERDEEHRGARLVLEIQLPEGFPEKHREGVVRAADLCSVKKHIFRPPAIEIRTNRPFAAFLPWQLVRFALINVKMAPDHPPQPHRALIERRSRHTLRGPDGLSRRES